MLEPDEQNRKLFLTMFDGGEPDGNEPDGEGNEPDGNEPEGDEGGGNDQEFLELFGNKYSLDETGRTKLVDDAKNFERAYHDSRRELADYREILDREGENDDEDEETKSPYPFDESQLSPEDKQVLDMLKNLVSTQTESQIKKVLEPIMDSQIEKEINDELKEIESTYGKFNKDELLRYAKTNGLESNLVAAYRSMTYDQQIEKGRKLELSDRERKKSGIIPDGKKSSGDKIPKYNKEEHGKMDLRDILEKYM